MVTMTMMMVMVMVTMKMMMMIGAHVLEANPKTLSFCHNFASLPPQMSTLWSLIIAILMTMMMMMMMTIDYINVVPL